MIENSHWSFVKKRPLYDYDYTSLMNLYQPIIGNMATSFYLTLANYIFEEGTYSRTILMRICQMSDSQITKSRQILEAIGLIETYKQKLSLNKTSHNYEIIAPLPGDKFLECNILSWHLHRVLGEESFTKIKKFFSKDKVVLKEGVDITKKFSEVFGDIDDYNIDNLVKISNPFDKEISKMQLEGNSYNVSDTTKNRFIDINVLKINLKTFIKEWTPHLISLLQELAHSYKLNEKDFIKILQNPYVTRLGEVNIHKLGSYIEATYGIINENIIPNHKTDIEHIKWLNTLTPLKLLSLHQKGGAIPSCDLDIINTLRNDYGFSDGVINVLLEYVLYMNNFMLPKRLVEKIAGHWKRLQIMNTEEAFLQIKKEKTQKTRKNKLYKKEIQTSEILPKAMLEKEEENLYDLTEEAQKTKERIRLKIEKMRKDQELIAKRQGIR